jgi:hypothetical protein
VRWTAGEVDGKKELFKEVACVEIDHLPLPTELDPF